MALILDLGPDGKGAEMLHPLLVNRWRLGEWTAGGVEHDIALTFQATMLSFREEFKLFKKNELSLVFEEDRSANVAVALDALVKAGKGTIVIEYLDQDDTPIKQVKFYGVKIVAKYSDLNYADHETVKAFVTCTFKKSELIVFTK